MAARTVYHLNLDADQIEGVKGTSKSSINPVLRKDADLKPGLNLSQLHRGIWINGTVHKIKMN